MGTFDDDGPIVPITGPVDPANPPTFPGKLPHEVSGPLVDQLQKMAEQVNDYLGPDHRAIAALMSAATELGAATYPKLHGYAERTP